ncbi:MAG: hypothetical protein ACRCT6_03235 [Notoacmeibacter sp.]
MKSRPILFSAPMVLAILKGAKTQTRRIVKPQPDKENDGYPYWYIGGYRAWQCHKVFDVLRSGAHNELLCPYGKIGDRLWVRESWRYGDFIEDEVPYIRYFADGAKKMCWPAKEWEEKFTDKKWRPSIFMPRWASRITLEITGVRIERLHDISEDDAIAEGINLNDVTGFALQPRKGREGFRRLWQSINGPDSWSENPWAWAIEFKQTKE